MADRAAATANRRPEVTYVTPRIDFSEDYSTAAVKGKSALITGGALGIGRGCATGLAEAGAYVTIADINLDAGITLARELNEKGYHAQFVRCDVTNWDDITNAFKSAIAFSPDNTIDTVLPIAGIAGDSLWGWLHSNPYDSTKPGSNTPPAPPPRIIDINFTAVYNTVHAAVWYFQNFPGTDLSYSKNIVFCSSMAGYNGMSGSTGYNSSKWGVRGLFWCLRNMDGLLGQGKPKFRANLIAPTFVETNMTKGIAQYAKQTGATIKVAQVSDAVHVVMRMVADENVRGRAAAIAAEKMSFDLCDNALGEGVSQTMNDPDLLARFGTGLGVRGPETVEKRLVERLNGTQTAAKTTNGTEAVAKMEVV